MIGEFSALENLANSFIAVVPNLLGALVLLLLGWLIGRVVYAVVHKIMRKLRIDSYFKLEKGPHLTELLSNIIKWIIYLAFISAAVEVMGVNVLSTYFEDLLQFIMGLLGGIIVILVAYLIARYIQKHIKGMKTEYSNALSQIIFLFVMIIAVSIAFDVANIPNFLINAIIIIIVASVGLGLAIALGLGLKETVAKIAKKYEKKV